MTQIKLVQLLLVSTDSRRVKQSIYASEACALLWKRIICSSEKLYDDG